MKLIIKLVNKCPNNHRGEFIAVSRNQCEIHISKAKNKDVSEFGVTLLHELLHLWVTILQTHGLEESIRKEHKFIYEVVPIVIAKLSRIFRRKV